MKTKILGLLTVGLLSGATAQSAVVTFEDIGLGGGSLSGTSFTSGGFTFSRTAATTDTLYVYQGTGLCNGGCSTNGTQSLGVYNFDFTGPFEVLMAREGGGQFSLNGFDFATFFELTPSPGSALEIIGTKAGGGTVSQTFAFNAGAADFQSAVANSSFTGLDSLLFRSALFFPAIDNISVSESVPEPGTLALLGLGLAGLGLSRRRKAN